MNKIIHQTLLRQYLCCVRCCTVCVFFIYFSFSVLSVLLYADETQTLVFPRAASPEKHFQIQSPLPEKQAETISGDLEAFYVLWQTLWNKENTAEDTVKHRIRIFRNKNEYVFFLRRYDSGIARSNGFYYPQAATAFFFAEKNEDFRRVLFHEVTHQLCSEIFGGKKVSAGANFWIVEGAALFMETFNATKTQCSVGDITDNRLYAAKVYHFGQQYRLPAEKLVTLTASEVQQSKDIVKIYDRSAALVHLLMFAGNGKYRPALCRLLRDVYSGKAETDSLRHLTGLPYGKLDEMYETFLATVPD
ncbi:MAG: hypothetical protein LBT89_04535 [Planctomycetaceae bacterium]|jgi:hypothetical protein|nr:hypothetical protein [Planctomycetaceae bacterium]